jgi:starch synthase (maltosyl-transferring)
VEANSFAPPQSSDRKDAQIGAAPRIYYVNPLLLKGPEAWAELFAHVHNLGFDTVISAPLFARGKDTSIFVARSFDEIDADLELGGSVPEMLGKITHLSRTAGVAFMLDLVIDRMAQENAPPIVDPRQTPFDSGGRRLDLFDADQRATQLKAWSQRLRQLTEAGVAGFRCLGIDRAPPELWRDLIRNTRIHAPDTIFFAWTPGTGFDVRRGLAEAGFDGTFSSLAWWNRRDGWLVEEHEIQRGLGIQIAFPEAPFARRVAHGTESCEILRRKALQSLRLAASFDAFMVPMGFEFGATTPLDPTYGTGRGIKSLREAGAFDLSSEIRNANLTLSETAKPYSGAVRVLTASQSSVVALLQNDAPDARLSRRLRVTVINSDARKSAAVPMKAIGELAAGFLPLHREGEEAPRRLRLLPGETLVLTGERGQPVRGAPMQAADKAAHSPRLAVEEITPSVDGGRFAVKRIVGQSVVVEADIFGDTHDPLAAALLWRTAEDSDWNEVPMDLVENDRWRAEFPLNRVGRHEFAVETWRNPFAIFRYEFAKKHEAHLDLKLEIQEGKDLVREAAEESKKTGEPNLIDDLEGLQARLSSASPTDAADILLSAQAFEIMARADRKPFRVRSRSMPVDSERSEAAFSSWYQIFPRSQSGDAARHGTFDDVIGQLPRVKRMGFDVLYFPPIHPIGSTNRKGRNNSLKAAPGDPGSPYAIGAPEGGHDAIHPELGTFDDFRRLIDAAAAHGIELALDFAIQASPDHPWLKERPGWFAWRPDGTIRYAENPPKKYEDIVNVDFYGPDAVPDLWTVLRDIVQLWVDQGVKLFRVDNPHTKPFPFWEWLIGDIRSRHPDVVFLSEAFTRPKVMYRLAKIGFSQSYTYFTWRNTRHELETYLTELTADAPKDFFRPHFFVNTHDINPDFLQNAPRSAYLIRAALASTLSGLWGVYNGFELCEGRPDAKRKEYADSEKYEIRAWDHDRPGNIVAEITMLNRIRRENAALHSHLGLTLLPSSNPHVMFYEKATTARENVLLIAVNLDPYNYQESDIEAPLWRWNIPDHGSIELDDLVSGRTLTWRSKWQRVGLNPHVLPFSIYRVR